MVHTEGGLWPPQESCYFRGGCGGWPPRRAKRAEAWGGGGVAVHKQVVGGGGGHDGLNHTFGRPYIRRAECTPSRHVRRDPCTVYGGELGILAHGPALCLACAVIHLFPSGFPCNKCSAGPFQTQRELDVHTSVVHLTCVAAPMISTPSAATDPSQDLHGTFPAGRQGPHDLPRGFRGRPAGAEAEAAPAPPPPLAELACRFCPPHKQVQALDSKEALFLHVQEAHLR